MSKILSADPDGDADDEPGDAPRHEATRVDEVYHQILLSIVRGEVHAGMELKSTVLAKQLGVSRTPVVQALQRLASDGLVALEMNKRAVVRPGAENWLVEIHEMRQLLEPHAAATAAGHIPAETLERLSTLAVEARPHQSPNWVDAAQEFDFALHLAVADHCGNFAIGEAIRKCWSFKRLSYVAAPEPPANLERGYSQHLEILAALQVGDAETARVAMLFHLRSASMSRPTPSIV